MVGLPGVNMPAVDCPSGLVRLFILVAGADDEFRFPGWQA